MLDQVEIPQCDIKAWMKIYGCKESRQNKSEIFLLECNLNECFPNMAYFHTHMGSYLKQY